jgi:hypothetical protein
VTLGNAEPGVVSRQETGFANLLGPPAQVSEAILQRAGGQVFGLPPVQQDVDVLAFERAGARLAEAGFAQLACGQASERCRSACVA